MMTFIFFCENEKGFWLSNYKKVYTNQYKTKTEQTKPVEQQLHGQH